MILYKINELAVQVNDILIFILIIQFITGDNIITKIYVVANQYKLAPIGLIAISIDTSKCNAYLAIINIVME